MEPYLRKHGTTLRDGAPDEHGISYYFLTLDKRDNKEKSVELAKKFGVTEPFIFKATHYSDIDHENLIRRGFLDEKYARRRLKEKARVVGIHVSHTAALQHFLDDEKSGKWAMIFEEDAVFPQGESKAKEETIKYVKDAERILGPDKPQVHYIGHCYTGKGGKRVSERIGKATRFAIPRCRHAYIVNKAGAQKLLGMSWPMKDNGDEMWGREKYVYFSNDGNLIDQGRNDWDRKAAIRLKNESWAPARSTATFSLTIVLVVLVIAAAAFSVTLTRRPFARFTR